MGLSCRRPVVLPRMKLTGLPPRGRQVDGLSECLGARVRRIGWEQCGVAACDLGRRPSVRARDRAASGHRLEEWEAETFAARGDDQCRRLVVETPELCIGR